MRLLLLTILILISNNTVAQELRTKKTSSFNFQEIFTIDKKSKLKQGNYVKLDKNSNDTLVKGYFNDDKKVNVWTYFEKNNRIYLKYDYDRNVAMPINIASTKVDSIQIRTGDIFTLTRVDSSPLFIGYKGEFKSLIFQNFKAPASLFEKKLTGMSMASFVANKLGQIQDISIEISLSDDLDFAIEKSIESINRKWIPAKLDDNSVDSKIYVVYNIILTRDPKYKHESLFKDKPDLVVIDVIFFEVEREKKTMRMTHFH